MMNQLERQVGKRSRRIVLLLSFELSCAALKMQQSQQFSAKNLEMSSGEIKLLKAFITQLLSCDMTSGLKMALAEELHLIWALIKHLSC